MTSNVAAEAAAWSNDLVTRRLLSWYVISAGRVPNTTWRRMQASAHEAIRSARAARSAETGAVHPPAPE